MENLPKDTEVNLSDPNPIPAVSNDSVVSSIINFDDLAETKLANLGPRKNALSFLLVVVISATVASYILQSNCSDLPRGFCPAVNEFAIPRKMEQADEVGILVSSMFSDLKNGEFKYNEEQRIEGFDNLTVSFLNLKYQTNYFLGEQNNLSFEYTKNREKYTIGVPISKDSTFLYYDGDLKSKPFYTDVNGLLSSIKPAQKITIGLLTGELLESEKTHCDNNPNLCTILDVYGRNKKVVKDLIDVNTTLESTISSELPIYFVGAND
jgi:hypothetical protein